MEAGFVKFGHIYLFISFSLGYLHRLFVIVNFMAVPELDCFIRVHDCVITEAPLK